MANIAEIQNNILSDSGVDVANLQPLLTNPVTGTGTAGQVAYWNGTTTQTGSNSLLWDNATRQLKIAGASGNYILDLTTTSNSTSIRFEENSVLKSFIQHIGSTFATVNRREFLEISGTNGITFRTSAEIARFNGGNLLLNSTTDNGQRLQVYGSTLLRGSGTTSATTALLVQNSTPTELLTVRDSGEIVLHRNIRIGNAGTGAPNILPFTTTQSSTNATGTNLSFYSNTITESAINGTFTFTGEPLASASSNQIHLLSIRSFAPTSGTAVHNNFEIRPTINQTGGANGITRGLYVNPTLTSAADWRSVETSNNTGWAIYTAGTANSYFGGNVGVGTASPTEKLHVASGNATINGNIYFGNASHYLATDNSTYAMLSSNRNLQLARSGIPALTIDSSLNVVIGTTTPSARLHVRGSGTTSATTALLVQNSTPSELFKVLDNGATTINGLTSIVGSSTGTTPILRVVNNSSGNFTFSVDNTGTGNSNFGLNIDGTQKATIGYSRTGNFLGIFLQGYTENYFMMQINPDGSFQKNRSSDGAAEFKVFNGGSTIIGAATVNASAILQADSTTKGFLPPRMTTTQKNAIATPAAGLVVYDTTLNKLCVYTTAWETITSA